MKTVLAGVLGFFLFAAHGFAADDTAEKTITRSYAVAPEGVLTVDTDQGDIQVVTGDENKVNIVVERQVLGGASEGSEASALKRHKVKFAQEGNHIHVDATSPKSRGFSLHSPAQLTVHFHITVPRRFSAILNTSGGNVEITGLKGAADARTSGGDLNYTNIDGAVTAHSSGGNINVIGCTDKLEAQTSGGNVVVKDFTGESAMIDTLGGNVEVSSCEGTVQAKTSGGNITIANFSGPSAYAETAGGTISFDLVKQPSNSCWFHTNGGNIITRLAGDVGMNLNATTDGGTIMTEFPTSSTVPGKLSENHIEGRIGNGGPLLTLRTSGGDIQILKR